MRLLTFIRLFSVLLFPVMTHAQGGGDSLGGLTLPVGETSSIQSATLTFTAQAIAGNPFTINVLTQGSPALDFKFVNGGTCLPSVNYAIGDTCTVEYTFSPRFPGVRHGGVSLTIGTTVLANTYLRGTGLGPEAALAPPSLPVVGGSLYTPNQSFAIDGAGDIFIGEFFGIGNSSLLLEIPSGCMASSCQQVLTTFADFANPNLNAVTIDGSGNLYLAFYGTAFAGPTGGANVFELPRGCFQFSCAKQLGGSIISPWAIVVDQSGTGNVYVTGSYGGTTTSQNNDYVIEIPPGCTSVNCIVPISQPFGFPLYNLQIDSSGNLYFNGPDPLSNPSSNATYEIPAGCKSASCNIRFAGIGGDESSDAVDSEGNLYVAGYGGNMYGTITYEFPVGCTDSTCALTVPPNTFQWYLPRGQLFNGNIYRVNDGGYAITEYDFVDPATVTFPATVQGQASPQQTVTLTNEGNEPLVFNPSIIQPNPTISQYFQLDSTSSGTCGALISSSVNPTLAPNANCSLPLDFAPVAPALGTIDGQSVITDNSLNVASATQTIPLEGDAVLPGTTFLAFSSSLNPSSVGQSVAFTAQVTSPSGTPTGSVTFTDGATVLGAVTLNASGVALVTTTTLPPGAQTITATFNPTGIFLASSGTLQQQVYPDIAADTLLGVMSPISAGTAENLSVTVMATPVGVAPTGTVTLTDNGLPIATATIVKGSVSFPGVILPAGTDVLSCAYSGDANYGASNCTNISVTVNAAAAATALTLTPSANPVGAFTPISLTAVLSSNGSPVSGIQVNFSVDGTSIGSKTTNAQGTIVDNPGGGVQLAPGQHTIMAVSTANASYAFATATILETVNAIPTTSTLTAPSTSTYGSNVALSVLIVGNLTGSAAAALSNSGLAPGGTVTFYSNTVAIGTAAVIGGSAQLTTTSLAGGNDTITCSYSGDTNFAPSNCNNASVTVSNPVDFSITVTPGSQTVNPGDSVTYTVALAGVGGAFNSPVTLSVTGLPLGATASFGQQTVTPGIGPTDTSLTIHTSPTQANGPIRFARNQIYYGLFLLPLMFFPDTRRLLRTLQRRGYWIALGFLLLGLQALSGCGGGYFGPSPTSHKILVQGTAGTLSHVGPATLTLQ